MACREDCPLIHEATGQCKIVMLVNRLLGDIDGPVKTATSGAPTQTQSPLVADAMKPEAPFPELKVGGFLPSITGTISSPIEVREVGSNATPIAEFGLTDGAQVVKVTVWEPGDKLNNFNVGSWITLTSMSVKEYKGEVQINTTRKTKISR